MRRTLTAIALSSLFAVPALAAPRHHVAKGSTSSSKTTVVAGDSKDTKPADAKSEAKPEGEKSTKKTTKKSTKKSEAPAPAPAPAEGAPAK